MRAKIDNWITKVRAQIGALLNVSDPTVAQMQEMNDLSQLLERLYQARLDYQ